MGIAKSIGIGMNSPITEDYLLSLGYYRGDRNDFLHESANGPFRIYEYVNPKTNESHYNSYTFIDTQLKTKMQAKMFTDLMLKRAEMQKQLNDLIITKLEEIKQA